MTSPTLSSPTTPALNLSLFHLLRSTFGTQLEPLRCTKATLVHLSHTLEDMVLTKRLPALLFTGFQESSHWREETERYRALADIAQQVCIFAGGDLPPESSAKELHITLRGDDPFRQEWFVVLLSDAFSVLLCGQDRLEPTDDEATRQFDTLWSFDPDILSRVLDLLEQVIGDYRPDRLAKLQEARARFNLHAPDPSVITDFTREMIRFEEQLHQRLHQTSVALNEQLRWREDLTATLVHDLRSPLQGVNMAIDLLTMDPTADPASLLPLLQMARRSTANMEAMIQLILDTNQLAAGQLQLRWFPQQPKALISTALLPLQDLATAHGVSLITQVDGRPAVLWGDPDLLQRVIQNLVNNAIKFTDTGGTVTVGIALAPTGDAVELRVRDTGMGISPAALPNIFDRYYQARAGDRRGAGLGLYFCRLVSEAHGGTIRATSQVGVGTTITLVLPLHPPEQR